MSCFSRSGRRSIALPSTSLRSRRRLSFLSSFLAASVRIFWTAVLPTLYSSSGSSSGEAGKGPELFPKLRDRDLHLLRDFPLQGRAAQEGLEPRVGVLQPVRVLPRGAGKPVHLAEGVEHGTTDGEPVCGT